MATTTAQSFAGQSARHEEFVTRSAGDIIVSAGAGDDYISAWRGSDLLRGGLGRDYIDDTGGNNLIIGDDALYTEDGGGDWILSWGADTIFGCGGDDFINGRGDDDLIDGGYGNDVLWGGYGFDAIAGGGGDDIIYGGSAAAAPYAFSITVTYSGLTDTAIAARVWEGVDGGLALDDASADYLDGGDGRDRLYGQGGNDTLDGGSGIDWMDGGSGNDTYIVDETYDVVVEAVGMGYDMVKTSASFTLASGAEIEVLAATGPGSFRLMGNSFANTIMGGSGRDTMGGGGGNDRLTGGAGKDAFRFDTKLGNSKTDRSVNFDTITDFNAKQDRMQLDNAVFKKLGAGSHKLPKLLNKDFFVTGTNAKDANDYIIYNKKTGILSYDADGSGSRAAVEFARLEKHPSISYKDFFII
ncbi:calcium-binding protein [Microvirga sesbaniae]|uniref:calcium-binding protein n=1 Tax=Microvirga sesbaniae TaxID=681392 RepID=UPI0021C78A93|nr:calcium-binding protein [Microvirga sp. HBU67692]